MVLISSSSAHCIDGYVNRRQHLGMQTNFLPFAVNTRIFTFSWGKNENNSVHNKMVAVAETKQQRKLPHHLAKKHPFWPKGQAFWPKPVASAAAHTDISAGGKERRKKNKNNNTIKQKIGNRHKQWKTRSFPAWVAYIHIYFCWPKNAFLANGLDMGHTTHVWHSICGGARLTSTRLHRLQHISILVGSENIPAIFTFRFAG